MLNKQKFESVAHKLPLERFKEDYFDENGLPLSHKMARHLPDVCFKIMEDNSVFFQSFEMSKI